MDRTLRIHVFGRFEALWSDGEAAQLTGKKAQALLAYLAVESARPHTRDRLAALLWSETGDERARHNLRQALSKIRRCCGEVVESSGDSLRIDLERCDADVVEFERCAGSDNPEKLRRCLELYRGDLLEGLIPREPVYDEWLPVARSRLRGIACRAVDRLVHALVESDRIDEAIETLGRRLAMDPACEPAHRELMVLLAGIGRRSDALRQFQACAEALDRELGAEPSAETVSLYKSLQEARAERVPEPGTEPEPEPVGVHVEQDRPTVAVLPFENLSGDDDGYFVDGIVEDITTALSCFKSLLVIARGSSFAYRGRTVPERRIADELGTQFLVRGSVRRADRRVRINVQLLDAIAGLTVWGSDTIVSWPTSLPFRTRSHRRWSPRWPDGSRRLDSPMHAGPRPNGSKPTISTCAARTTITASRPRTVVPASKCSSVPSSSTRTTPPPTPGSHADSARRWSSSWRITSSSSTAARPSPNEVSSSTRTKASAIASSPRSS